jgi:ABC-type phosphate transport system substrate-binding protein
MKKYILTTIVLMFTILGIAHAQSIKIIVNSSNETSSLTPKEASDLFLKKKSKWANGAAVMPVDLNSGSNVREEFSQKIHGKSVAAIRNFWQQAAFSGTASAPPEKANDAEVIDFVKKNAGAIGYVSSLAAIDGVKVININ